MYKVAQKTATPTLTRFYSRYTEPISMKRLQLIAILNTCNRAKFQKYRSTGLARESVYLGPGVRAKRSGTLVGG